MGYMRHNAIIVTTGYRYDDLAEIDRRVRQLLTEHGLSESMVSPILASPMNGYQTLFVAPDGSKEGWEHSEAGDVVREAIVDLLRGYYYEDGSSPFAWVEVQYGDDELETKIVRSSDDDRRLHADEEEDGEEEI